MPLVKSHLRKKPVDDSGAPKVIVVTVPPEERIRRPTLRERIKENIAVPPKKKKTRPRNEYDDLAEGADEVVNTLENLEGK